MNATETRPVVREEVAVARVAPQESFLELKGQVGRDFNDASFTMWTKMNNADVYRSNWSWIIN